MKTRFSVIMSFPFHHRYERSTTPRPCNDICIDPESPRTSKLWIAPLMVPNSSILLVVSLCPSPECAVVLQVRCLFVFIDCPTSHSDTVDSLHTIETMHLVSPLSVGIIGASLGYGRIRNAGTAVRLCRYRCTIYCIHSSIVVLTRRVHMYSPSHRTESI
jgi:hypothetical protein